MDKSQNEPLPSQNETQQTEVPTQRRRVKKRRRKSSMNSEEINQKIRASFDDSQLIDDEFEKIKIEEKEIPQTPTKEPMPKEPNAKAEKNIKPSVYASILLLVAGVGLVWWFKTQVSITVPNFSKSDIAEIEKWGKGKDVEIKFNELNLTTPTENKVITQSVAAGKTIKRGETLEVFVNGSSLSNQKEMPDFSGRAIQDVKAWAKAKNIKLNVKEQMSTSVKKDFVFGQNIKAGTPLDDKKELSVLVSSGVSQNQMLDFSEVNVKEAQQMANGQPVEIKEVYSDKEAYGKFISQSIQHGEPVEGQKAIVNYSLGKPYLKSYFGKTEGDLSKIIFDEYTTRGVELSYSTYEVYSPSLKGTVVEMSSYNQYIPLKYEVKFGISNGLGGYWSY